MLDGDIKTYHSAEVSAVGTNGGRMSKNEITSGSPNNVWPNVPKAERLAGAVLHRKLHTKAADDADGTLMTAEEFIDKPTPGGDRIEAFVGTHTDKQSDLTGNERKYGAAILKNNISTPSSTFTVIVEDSTLASGTQAIFKDGDKIRLTDKTTPDAATGNEEFLTITGTPTVANNVEVTITVVETIANNYLVANDGRAMSRMEPGDIKCSVANWVETSTAGTYNEGTHPIITDNIGTVEDAVTVEFTDATHFTVTGTSGISYGSGDTSTNFAPNNADFSKPYFTLESAGWGGTWAAGEKITFDIHPASFTYWLRRTVPAACPSLANNKLTTVTTGESDQ